MLKDNMDTPLTPDNFATLYDVNIMAEAVMEDVIEHRESDRARIEALEATDAERSEREAIERRHSRWPARLRRSRLWAAACLLWTGTGR